MASPPGLARDEAHEDSVYDMWSEYLEIVDDYDQRLTEGWKEDANGVLVFTGLFSATVATFIVASYPQLSANTGSQTVQLLEHLSQQFSGFANGTYVPPGSSSSSPPSASIVCVNVLWVLSFLLSTTSALFATLMQQWGRIYIDLPQSPSISSERARVRSFLFLGMQKYRMNFAVETAPTLLHLSVFLFYIGLVIFFFTIYNTVAIATLIFVGLFGLAYLTLTIISCLDHSCPYRTPMSRPWWYLWHTSLSLVAWLFRFFLNLFHGCLVSYNPGDVTTLRQRLLSSWLEFIDDISKKHRDRLKDGFRETVVKYALGETSETDVKALTWLFQLPALTEKSKIQKFVASIPGETIIQLLSNASDGEKITFRHHLSTLIRSCAPGTVGLTEKMHKGRLLVCLNAIHHIAKASTGSPSLSPSLLDDMRSRFANITLMRPLWADSDPAIRVTARSICALFARQLLRRSHLEAGELAWLQDVMGRPSSMIFNARNNLATVDSMNVDSFVTGVLSQQTEVLPNAQATFFKETLQVVMNTNSQTSLQADTFEEWLSSLILRMEHEEGHQDRDNVVDNLRRMSSSTTVRPQSQASGS